VVTAIGLTPGSSSTVHIYTQTIHRTTQLIWEGCESCLVFASYTLTFALQLRKSTDKLQLGGSNTRFFLKMVYITHRNMYERCDRNMC